uniref:(northern house mosquito) hypothetical protein n=1 Tax=Culex pipiens TaxID=7175 RepID=A0A8D8BRT5_CULPI
MFPPVSSAPPPRELGGYLPTPFTIKQEKLESSSSRFGGSEPAATTTVGGSSSATPDSKVSKNNSSFTLSLRHPLLPPPPPPPKPKWPPEGTLSGTDGRVPNRWQSTTTGGPPPNRGRPVGAGQTAGITGTGK